MKISEIKKYPRTNENYYNQHIHESILRSFNILEKVKYYLKENVPAKIILELIEEMEENE